LYSASVHARIFVTVVVVHVVSFCIQLAGAAARSYHHAVFVNIWSVLPALLGVNSDTVTAHVFQFTLNTHVFDMVLLETLIHVQALIVSCFQFHVVLSLAVTNLFVVVLSLISSAFNVTAHVLLFTLVTASVGLNNSFQLAAVLYGAWLNT
jgi:hypothetical protein